MTVSEAHLNTSTRLVPVLENSTQENKQRAYDSGFNLFVAKPDLFVAKPMGVETLKEVLTVIDPGAATLTARDLAHRLAEVWKRTFRSRIAPSEVKLAAVNQATCPTVIRP
jgi:hypothetical protein